MCLIQFMVFVVVKLLQHMLGTTHELSLLGVNGRKQSNSAHQTGHV